ncbi:MAG: lipid-A-disaccharide synthase [Pseudomonadota bacterium]
MSLRVFVVAGETSGDFLAARLLRALGRTHGPLTLEGVGGSDLQTLGLETLFPMEELSLMGIQEVLPHIPRLLRRIGQTADAARTMAPDLVLTVDAPAFTLRVLRRLRGLDVPKVHYVAPQAWAWRPGRAARLAEIVDRLLLVLPFEPAFFDAYGAPGVYVGHPIVEQVPALPTFTQRQRPGPSPVLCLLPGSREGEIRRHLPVLRGAVGRLAAMRPGLTCVLPTPPRRAAQVRALTEDWPTPLAIVAEPSERFDAYARSTIALAASGTVGLELALARLPTVILYRTSWLTAAVVRRLVRVPYASLVNLVADRPVLPELLQEGCTADGIAAAATTLLDGEAAWSAQVTALDDVAHVLGSGEVAPSERAAAAVAELLAEPCVERTARPL